MPFRIADLVEVPELGLSVAAAPEGLDRPIEAAHTSELLRPGQWLHGGELLMMTGLVLPMEAGACRAYVRDVADGGASGLALGLGPQLPYQEAPEPLVAAAGEAGLPLLVVPAEVPFIAVTKTVFAARAAEQRRVLERAYETQRRLTAAAASGRGLAATLEAWTRATGAAAVVTDPLGRPLASAGPDAEGLLAAGADLVDKVAARGVHGSGTSIAGTAHVQVQPLGARRLRGLLVLTGTLEAPERMLASGLVSLLSLELERRHLADEPERRRRSALLERLLAGGASQGQPGGRGTGEETRDVLAQAGLATETVRGVVVEPAGEAAEVAADLALAVRGGLARVADGVVEAVVGDDLDACGVLGRFAPGSPAGIGAAVPPESAAGSLRQAHGLLEVSRRSGRPAEAREAGSSRLLWEVGDRHALRGYADAVLGALDAADPAGDLVSTLAAWLDAAGSWDEAGRRLAVHRHTVRNRVDKAMRLTGRRVENGDDRFDLWLATRIRRETQRG